MTRHQSSVLVRHTEVLVSEHLLAWATQMPRYRSKRLDEASERSSLEPFVGKLLLKKIACFMIPPLRCWGPFL